MSNNFTKTLALLKKISDLMSEELIKYRGKYLSPDLCNKFDEQVKNILDNAPIEVFKNGAPLYKITEFQHFIQYKPGENEHFFIEKLTNKLPQNLFNNNKFINQNLQINNKTNTKLNQHGGKPIPGESMRSIFNKPSNENTKTLEEEESNNDFEPIPSSELGMELMKKLETINSLLVKENKKPEAEYINKNNNKAIENKKNVKEMKETVEEIAEQEPKAVEVKPEEITTISTPKKLSKKDLCDLIRKQFLFRYKILAAILTALPHIHNNKVKFGFCMKRWIALQNSFACLNPEAIKNTKQNLLKYSSATNKQACQKLGGYIYEIPKELQNKMKSSPIPIQEQFIKTRLSLEQDFINDIQMLFQLTKPLLSAALLDNNELSQLANKVKVILEHLYQSCEESHNKAILSLYTIGGFT